MYPVAQAQESTPPAPGEGQRHSVERPLPAPDTDPPRIAQPQDIFFPAVDATGAQVFFELPTANDDTDGPIDTVCDWGSGSTFSLGNSVVTCYAVDAAGNGSSVLFLVTVVDQEPPTIALPADVVFNAADPAGANVNFGLPDASDNVDGVVDVSCDWRSGAFFPVGITPVTCVASDLAGNVSQITFNIVVNPLPTPTIVPEPTSEPLPTLEPTPTLASPETPVASGTPTVEPTTVEIPATSPTAIGEASPTVAPSPTATVVPTPSPISTEPAPTAVQVPEGLDLPWPPPGHFTINTWGGPLNGIDAIWGYQSFPISQEFGHTEFSIIHPDWYGYGLAYGLDGYEHPGLDIAMPAGTWLYSPVEGMVVVSGDTPFYTFYGSGDPGVGELLIRTDEGHEVVLGHMGRISVNVGDHVTVGEFVGLSGGDNGDHLHVEVRESQPEGWYRVVDPRSSFLVDVLRVAALDSEELPEANDSVEMMPTPQVFDTSLPWLP